MIGSISFSMANAEIQILICRLFWVHMFLGPSDDVMKAQVHLGKTSTGSSCVRLSRLESVSVVACGHKCGHQRRCLLP